MSNSEAAQSHNCNCTNLLNWDPFDHSEGSSVWMWKSPKKVSKWVPGASRRRGVKSQKRAKDELKLTFSRLLNSLLTLFWLFYPAGPGGPRNPFRDFFPAFSHSGWIAPLNGQRDPKLLNLSVPWFFCFIQERPQIYQGFSLTVEPQNDWKRQRKYQNKQGNSLLKINHAPKNQGKEGQGCSCVVGWQPTDGQIANRQQRMRSTLVGA